MKKEYKLTSDDISYYVYLHPSFPLYRGALTHCMIVMGALQVGCTMSDAIKLAARVDEVETDAN
jgi:hypothetical protein